MKINELNLEMLIKSYAKMTGKNGVFIKVLEHDANLAKILGLSKTETIDYIDSYLYLTDFNDDNEIEAFFSKIEKESHPDAQYMALVIDGEIVKEFYYGS